MDPEWVSLFAVFATKKIRIHGPRFRIALFAEPLVAGLVDLDVQSSATGER